MAGKTKQGQIFLVPLPGGGNLFGRVTLDINAHVRMRRFPPGSPLVGFGKAYLIEMYSQVVSGSSYSPSPVLIPGALIQPDMVGAGWPFVAYRAVDPRTVGFPESIIGHMHPKGRAHFECGEISVPIPLTDQEFQDMEVRRTMRSGFLWPYVCLWALGRRDEIPSDYVAASLEWSDLRFSKYRDKIYKYLPFKPSMSYFEQQKQMGLNLDRLFEE
jgi:hypothetical protein